MTEHAHVPPSDCPVCGDRLRITRLGCASCGTELSGRFESCAYCSLGVRDRRILHTFLASRGNMRVLARDLGVSYPTARQRFAELLDTLGIGDEAEVADDETGDAAVETQDVLRRLAAGELDVDEVDILLGANRPGESA